MKHLSDIFTKAELAGMSLSFKDAAAPPATYYASADLYELERERIFLKEWLWVGHAAQVAKLGRLFHLRSRRGTHCRCSRSDEQTRRLLARVCPSGSYRGSRPRQLPIIHVPLS